MTGKIFLEFDGQKDTSCLRKSTEFQVEGKELSRFGAGLNVNLKIVIHFYRMIPALTTIVLYLFQRNYGHFILALECLSFT